jgi:PilZ domain
MRSIPDSQSARISLSTTAGETLYLDCNYREGSTPRFFLIFPAKDLPKEINTSQQCSITISNRDSEGIPLVLKARIEEIMDDSTMELTAQSIVDPTTLRQYFRVAIFVPVTISFTKESDGEVSRHWSLTGETLDISGSGLLALFDDECEDWQGIEITLELSSPKASVICMGHVVQARRVRRRRWQIALHFDNITNKQRDIIISNCLYEQRRQLKKGLQPIT